MTAAREQQPPPMGDFTGTERRCSRFLHLNADGTEHVCRKPAVVHIIWSDDGTDVEAGWACEGHREEALTRWSSIAHHPVGACCGMPGARWFPDENECRYEAGLPIVEPVRAVARGVYA